MNGQQLPPSNTHQSSTVQNLHEGNHADMHELQQISDEAECRPPQLRVDISYYGTVLFSISSAKHPVKSHRATSNKFAQLCYTLRNAILLLSHVRTAFGNPSRLSMFFVVDHPVSIHPFPFWYSEHELPFGDACWFRLFF